MSNDHSTQPTQPVPDLRRPSQPASPPAAEAPPPVEDAGSQALAEALRSSFRIVKVLMVGLVLVFIASGIFAVDQNEVAVLLRFGRPVGAGSEQLLKPGLHWAFPEPIDEIVRIPVGQSHTVVSSAGWFATSPEMEALGQTPPPQGALRPGIDGYALTADGNIIHARATLKYRLQPGQAMDYTFNFTHPTNLLVNVLNNALFYAATHFTADEAIFLNKMAFSDRVHQRVVHLIDALQLGVTMETIDVETRAPLDVLPAFNEVLSAQQARSTNISQAQAYARSVTNTAVGQASVILSGGLSRSNQLVKTVAAEAKSFSDQLPYYRSDPQLFKQRLLLQSMQRVLTNAEDTFFVPTRADGKPRELRLQLNREPLKAKTPSQP